MKDIRARMVSQRGEQGFQGQHARVVRHERISHNFPGEDIQYAENKITKGMHEISVGISTDAEEDQFSEALSMIDSHYFMQFIEYIAFHACNDVFQKLRRGNWEKDALLAYQETIRKKKII